MEHRNIHFDEKLREMQSQQLPDLSHIETHWKTMQAQLPVANRIMQLIRGKLWTVITVALLITATALISFLNSAPIKTMNPVKTSLQDTVPQKKVMRTDTTVAGPRKHAVRKTVKDANRQDSIVVKKHRTAARHATPVHRAKTKAPCDTIIPASPRKTRVMRQDTLSAVPRRKKVPQKVQLVVRTSDGKDTVVDAIVIENASLAATPSLEFIPASTQIKQAVLTLRSSAKDPGKMDINLGYKDVTVPSVQLKPVKATVTTNSKLLLISDSTLRQ